MLGCTPALIHGTAPLDAGFCCGGRENTDHLLVDSTSSLVLIDPADNTPRLGSADLGSMYVLVCYRMLSYVIVTYGLSVPRPQL